MYCSPSHHKHAKKGTCFSPSELNLIAKTINEKEKKVVIKGKDKKKVIEQYFQGICQDKEYCWLEQLDYNTRKRLEEAFRPIKPRSWNNNPRTWLNTDDIMYVMKQYESLHKDFKFLGVHPIDFAERKDGICIGYDLCDFDIRNFKKQKRFAMVLNLDHHNEPGSHWVAIYCSLYQRKQNFGIYYYDSTSNPPGPEVQTFMEKVSEQVKRDFKPNIASKFAMQFNSVQRQFKNSECGMFCIVFLTQCVKNIKFDEICERMKQDDDINNIRNILYRPPK